MPLTVDVLTVARQTVPGPQAFWMRDWGEHRELAFQVFVIRDGRTVTLVNSGPGAVLAELNAGVERRVGARFVIRAEERGLVDQLADLGVAPDDVDHIVCTPIQGYTTGGLLDFPRARVHLSRTGWLAFHSRHDHPHDVRSRMFDRDTLIALVTDRWDHVSLVDDGQVAAGVEARWVGAHHRSSLAVLVEGASRLAITDCFFLPGNLADRIPPGINESLDESLEAYEWLSAPGVTAVSTYDPEAADRVRAWSEAGPAS